MKLNFEKIFEILIYSLKQGFLWKWWKFLLTGSIGSLLGVLQFGKNFFQWELNRSIIFAVASIVAIYLFRVFLVFIVQSLKYFHEVYRNSNYGEAILLMKDSFATFHLYRKTPGHQDEAFMASMVLLCNNLKLAYDKITNSECSVSIKVPLSDSKIDEKAILSNLTRDTPHSKKDTSLNRDTDKYCKTKHTLIGNTAFSHSFNKVIKNQKEKHYINNNVNNCENYENTSKECHENGILPYNSELVYPIVPLVGTDSTNFDCHGFICIDSNKENAFKTIYDIGIVAGVADGIYDIMADRNNFKNQQNGQVSN
jgi:hypothetical protein